jgi:hypothetical protein
MKLVDSKIKQLDYSEILYIYHSNEKHEDKRLEDFKVWLATNAAIIANIKADGAIIGNTFFMYRRGPAGKEHTAMVWAMNADTLQNMVDNVAEGLTRLVDMGVTDILASYNNSGVTRVMRQAFRKISSEGDDLAFNKASDGTIFMRMSLSGGDNV